MASHKRILKSLGNNRPTKRNLFGPVDRERLQLEYQESLRKDLEDASRRWDFDFTSEKPLDGGVFQWEVISGTKVPLLYRSSMPGQGHLKGQTVVEVKANSHSLQSPKKENILLTPQRCVLNHQNLEKTPAKQRGEKRKQTNITDFYPAKRRVVDENGKRKLKGKQMNITG
jgi:hypothetical protein